MISGHVERLKTRILDVGANLYPQTLDLDTEGELIKGVEQIGKGGREIMSICNADDDDISEFDKAVGKVLGDAETARKVEEEMS